MTQFNHATYISPFTWRYGSQAMRSLWSEETKRRMMRQVWVALATAQNRAGLVTAAQLADLEAQVDNIDIARSLEIEKETRHDVMAEIRAFAEYELRNKILSIPGVAQVSVIGGELPEYQVVVRQDKVLYH